MIRTNGARIRGYVSGCTKTQFSGKILHKNTKKRKKIQKIGGNPFFISQGGGAKGSGRTVRI
ncbi:hypothetical protein WN55_00782 [Dufourea novaeangliae]|uniref:Uncharacterized protein n=1 Tax=Dufourea novaeangliae TaxID=178035 RepID=A0A154PCJ5_DUFNO|nr:hypothetical protein WN55_00782 [Dufourea novaeangliae]